LLARIPASREKEVLELWRKVKELSEIEKELHQ